MIVAVAAAAVAPRAQVVLRLPGRSFSFDSKMTDLIFGLGPLVFEL
jgi:hypothetical protein